MDLIRATRLFIFTWMLTHSILILAESNSDAPPAVKIKFTKGYQCTEGPGDWFEVKLNISGEHLPEGLGVDDFIFKKLVRGQSRYKDDQIYELRNAIDGIYPLYLTVPNADPSQLPKESICRLDSAKNGLIDILSDLKTGGSSKPKRFILKEPGYCATHKMVLRESPGAADPEDGTALFYNRITSNPDGTGNLIWSEHRASAPQIVITGDAVIVDGMSQAQLESRWKRVFNNVDVDTMYRPENVAIPQPIDVTWRVLHPQDKEQKSIYEFKISISYELNSKYDPSKPLAKCE